MGRDFLLASHPCSRAKPSMGRDFLLASHPCGRAKPSMGRDFLLASHPCGRAKPSMGRDFLLASHPCGRASPSMGCDFLLSLLQDLALKLDQVEDAFLAEAEELGKRGVSEWITFRRSLDFHKLAFVGHDDVEIDIGGGIFGVVEVE